VNIADCILNIIIITFSYSNNYKDKIVIHFNAELENNLIHILPNQKILFLFIIF